MCSTPVFLDESRRGYMDICDARFKYTPSLSTNVVDTWKRFGFKPTTRAERLLRQRRSYADDAADTPGASVARLKIVKQEPRRQRLGSDTPARPK
jgi:hypothetical protein